MYCKYIRLPTVRSFPYFMSIIIFIVTKTINMLLDHLYFSQYCGYIRSFIGYSQTN